MAQGWGELVHSESAPPSTKKKLTKKEEKKQKPSNNGLSTLLTFSQPRTFLATMYSISTNPPCLFLKKLSIYITVEAFPRPPLSGSYPPLDRVTHPGAKSDVGGWVGRQPHLRQPPTTPQHSSSPRESRPLSWPFCHLGCCREALAPAHFP